MNIPREVTEMFPEFEYFVETMARKLYTNRHKGDASGTGLGILRDNFAAEIGELKEAFLKKGQFEVLVEAADVANMAFLLAAWSVRKTRLDFNNEKRVWDEH